MLWLSFCLCRHFILSVVCAMDTELQQEADLRRRRCEAFLRGEFLGEDAPVEVETEESPGRNEQENLADYECFSEEDLQQWDGEKAIKWILEAKHYFEVLGIRPVQCPDITTLRNRYRKLSLLVHPDKNKQEAETGQATASFQRLSDAMRVMVDDAARDSLFQEIQESGTNANEDPLSGKHLNRYATEKSPCFEDEKSQDSEDVVNEAVKDKVMQRSNLQRLTKRRKTIKSEQGPKPSSQMSMMQQWQQMAAAAETHADQLMPDKLSQLWQDGGDKALAEVGWKQLESRREPGRFYFAHVATGRTAVSPWEKRQSRHDPSVHYYLNVITGQTSLCSSLCSKMNHWELWCTMTYYNCIVDPYQWLLCWSVLQKSLQSSIFLAAFWDIVRSLAGEAGWGIGSAKFSTIRIRIDFSLFFWGARGRWNPRFWLLWVQSLKPRKCQRREHSFPPSPLSSLQSIQFL